MIGLRLQNLQRHEDPREGFPAHYTAEVVNGPDVLPVTRARGSWQTTDFRHEVRPDVAAWLQREVGKAERSAARGGGDE